MEQAATALAVEQGGGAIHGVMCGMVGVRRLGIRMTASISTAVKDYGP